MSEVRSVAQRTIDAPVAAVRAAVADYTESRPAILSSHYGDYEVREGGTGDGTRVHWTLAATRKRVRDCLLDVSEPEPGTLVETDANSSMVTTWQVQPTGEERSTVTVTTTWQGAGGVGGFFERMFAPAGLRRIHDEVLGNLDERVRSN